jgi:hypothetical protein
MPHTGTIHFMEAPGGRGTEVKLFLEYTPTGLSAVLAKLFYEVTAQQLKETLRRFKQIMETGEFPTNDGQTSGRDSDQAKLQQAQESRAWQPAGVTSKVEEASWESFPASDPPSFNPGRAETELNTTNENR